MNRPTAHGAGRCAWIRLVRLETRYDRRIFGALLVALATLSAKVVLAAG